MNSENMSLLFIVFGLSLLVTRVKSADEDEVDETLFGCFQVPKQCPNSNITFWLYKNSEEQPHELKIEDPETIKSAPFTSNEQIVFLIHGYTGNRTLSPNIEIRPELFKYNKNINVVSLDYGPLVKSPCYFSSLHNIEVVGKCTAQLIEKMLEVMEIPLKLYYLVGFSLGAHVAGWTAEYFTVGKFPRITGLDPAGPLFWFNLQRRLSEKDADFVDGIHTNSAVAGEIPALDTVDFYCNGGSQQPGCFSLTENPENVQSCNHRRAPEYYGESINSQKGFWGKKLEGLIYRQNVSEWQIMGYHTPTSAKGIYKVKTASSPPYALGKAE